MQYIVKSITSEIVNQASSLIDNIEKLEEEQHRQKARHYDYIESNENTIKEIKQNISKLEEATKAKLHKLNICILILCIGLLCAGVALFAITYHLSVI